MTPHPVRVLAAVAATAVATALALTGCSAGTCSTGSAGSKDNLTLALSADLPGWNPAKMIGAGPALWAQQAVYDSIFDCNALGQPRPNIAEKYEVGDGNTKLTLHLRSGMTFSDGTAVDAAAVVDNFTYEAKNGIGASHLAGMTAAATDAHTVTITSATPQGNFAPLFCGFSIASPKYLASGNVDAAPVGSGPYRYDASASTAGSVYVFTKSTSNWNAARFPYKKITLKLIADPTATLNALKSGQVAGAVTQSSTIAEADAAGLKHLTLHGVWAGLVIADRDGKVVPALGNADVRRAINMVFDKDAIAKKLYDGDATPTSQIFRKGSAAWIDGLKDPYPYDVAKAKALMAKAGYADGFDLQLPYIAGFGLDAAMPVVIQQLGLLNIHATQTTLSGPNAILDLISGKYPVIFWPLGNIGNSLVDIQQDVDPTTAVWNPLHTTDATVTSLLGKLATDDATQSAKDQQALNQHLIDQAWFAPMVNPDGYFSFDPRKVDITKSDDQSALVPTLIDFR